MISLLAILTLVVQIALLVAFAAWVIERVSGRRSWSPIAGAIGADSLRLAALVAVTAVAGSLYFSEVKNFQPCNLCWYQRIALYPQALILTIAAVRRDCSIWIYSLPLALIGIAISIYHYQLERFPDQAHVACSATIPCTTIWFEQFGYITITMMALTASTAIAVLVRTGARHGQGVTNEG